MADSSDSFYTLEYSSDGTVFKKIPKLQSAQPPSHKKVVDETTSTDDHIKVEEPIDFFDGSEIDFEYVHVENDPEHIKLKTAYENNTELTWRYKFTQAPSLSKQFKGRITELTPTPDPKKKLRQKGRINISSKPIDIPVAP